MDLPKQKTSQREIGDRARKATSSTARRQSDAKAGPVASKTSEPNRRVSKTNSRNSHSDTVSQTTSLHEHNSTRRARPDSLPAAISAKRGSTSTLPVISFAVIGNNSVGKTTFIRNALDLRRAPNTAISTSKVALGGVLYLLRLIETPRSLVNFIDDEIVWPGLDETSEHNSIDGVICLYDVSNKKSLEGLPELLAALDATEVATCLAPCKVEIPLCDHTVSSNYPEIVKSKFPSILSEETSFTLPDSAKRCLLKVLKQHLATSEVNSSTHPLRSIYPPRTSSRNPSESSLGSQSGSRQQSVYSRSKENLLKQTEAVIESEPENEAEPISEANMAQSKVSQRPHTPDSAIAEKGELIGSTQEPSRRRVPNTPESLSGATLAWRGSTETANRSSQQTFLNMDDESIHESGGDKANDSDDAQKDDGSSEISQDGVTFGELVDRLLAMPTTKTDQKFVPAFLCLFRAFATPLDLLGAIMERFVKTEKSEAVAFTKTAEALRYLSILGTWTTYYPGDFADTKVRDTAVSFVNTVGETKNYAAAARQIANNLRTTTADEDQDWAYGNTGANRSRSTTDAQRLGSTATTSSGGRSQPRRSGDDSDEDSDSDEDDEDNPMTSSARYSATTSSASSLVKPSQVSSQTSDNLHNLESARSNARRLFTIPHILATKIQWRQFMDYNVEELATEITRVDWTMYSAIRPRDFIRWVLLPARQRIRPGHADYIGMMTRQFNHLALFVTGMILLRDKPKHRAAMIEKLMDLAWEIRRKNNYHALGAMVAGLSSESIIRLTQTQELVSPERHKRFLRLKVLMSHQKSHAAYRMAWENTSRERIPYVAGIQGDLTKAEIGNSTFVSGKLIKWSKFEIMGDTIVTVLRSQEQPYVLPDRTARGQEIAKLILETKIIEDDQCDDADNEMYERSKLLEPTGSTGKHTKFDWLKYR